MASIAPGVLNTVSIASSGQGTVSIAPMARVRPADPHPDPSWSGWGDRALVPELPDAVRRLLTDALGVRGGARAPGSISELQLPPPRVERSVLEEILGPDGVLTADADRIRHLRGKSTPDLLRLRAGDLGGAPDLILLPASPKQVLDVLRVCSERQIAVVPFGGGTSVVGGLEPEASGFMGMISLDVRRLNALVELDEESRLAVLEPGLRGPQAEQLLGARGYTIGHFPQSFEYATLGGFAAARSSGQASSGYGRFDELVLALDVATPAGTLSLGRAPRSAAGPDLRQLILGSEGALGVITSLTVQVRPVPEARVYDGWRFDSFAAGLHAVRRLAQDGPLPTVLRLSDEVETALSVAGPGSGGSGKGCLLIAGYDGATAEVDSRRSRATLMLQHAGGRIEPGAAETWERERYRGPYLRDALLDSGALVETLETVSFWSRLPGLYEAVREALRESLQAQGTPAVVLCHVSHVYPSGGSLYFTVVSAQADDPVAQWRAAKGAGSDAILAAGGSITHHHGVGTDHRAWYEREVGPLAIDVLRAVKSTLDPAGIMNPGVLIPR
jgi:alkyldihydroxyacetonephosphate synthase